MKRAIDSSGSGERLRTSGSPRARSLPGQEKSPLRRNGVVRVGTPSTMPSGIGCSRPRRTT